MEAFEDGLQAFVGSDALRAWIIAAVIVLATYIVSRALSRIIRRLTQIDGAPLPSSSIIVNIVRVAVWGIGLSLMLSGCFGVDVNALITALGIGGVALSLGMQDTLKNFIGGIQVTLTKIVEPGDHVAIGGVEGIVQDVTWRQTVVRDYEGALHLIPNATVNATTVDKMSPANVVSTVVVLNTDGRDIDEVLAECERLAAAAVAKVAPLERDPWLLVTQIGEYGIWCKMRFVLADVEHAREARDAALRAIAPYTRNSAAELGLDSSASLAK